MEEIPYETNLSDICKQSLDNSWFISLLSSNSLELFITYPHKKWWVRAPVSSSSSAPSAASSSANITGILSSSSSVQAPTQLDWVSLILVSYTHPSLSSCCFQLKTWLKKAHLFYSYFWPIGAEIWPFCLPLWFLLVDEPLWRSCKKKAIGLLQF